MSQQLRKRLPDVPGPDPLVGLIERICARDQTALAALYELTVERLYAIAFRVLDDASDAEEIVVDALKQAWDLAPRFDPARGSVLGWLGNLAWSRAIDRRRRDRHQRANRPLHLTGDADTYALLEEDCAAKLLNAFQQRDLLRVALATLSAAQQRMIALAFFEDCSHSEIAKLTGVPVGTVKSHIRRGLELLRGPLTGEDVDGP